MVVKLSYAEGRFEYILDTWSSIRSSIEDNHLYISTSDKKSILFNREICCFLSPVLSSLIKDTFQGSCCLTNYETYIILPDVSSKAVYDLQSLMIKGTVSGLSGDDAKELKSLHNFLGFKSVIVKEENDDEITVEHEYRIEEDRTDGDGGYDGDIEGEDANQDDRSLKVESRGVAINDDTVNMTAVDVPIPTSCEEKDDDVDMSALEKDPSTNENNGQTTLDFIGRAEKTTSASNTLKDNASVMDEDLNEQSRDNGEEGNQTRTSAEKRHVNDKRVGGKVADKDVYIPTTSKEKDDDADINVQQLYNPADDVNIRNSHEDLEENEDTSTENNGKTTPDFIAHAEDPAPASKKVMENASVMDEDQNERNGDNGEEENVAHTSSENLHAVNSSEIPGDHKNLNMKCYVKLEKLKKLVNEDHESSEVKSRPRQKKYSIKKEKSYSDDSDFDVDVENTSPAKKRKRFARSKPPVNYNDMSENDTDE